MLFFYSKNTKAQYFAQKLRKTPFLKAKQRVIQFYFRKRPLQQQKFLVVAFFSNLLWLLRY